MIPFEDLLFEGKIRHKNGALIPVHCKEAAVISKFVRQDLHVFCPSWWVSVEELYGGRAEFPPFISYLGLSLMRRYYIKVWSVVRTELSPLCFVELIHLVRMEFFIGALRRRSMTSSTSEWTFYCVVPHTERKRKRMHSFRPFVIWTGRRFQLVNGRFWRFQGSKPPCLPLATESSGTLSLGRQSHPPSGGLVMNPMKTISLF